MSRLLPITPISQRTVGPSGFQTLGAKTESAGTPINRIIPPGVGVAKVAKVLYTAAATAHTLTAMRVLGSTRLSGNANSGQPVIDLAADPGPSGNSIAANDWLIVRNDDGSLFVAKVSSVSTLAITLTANLSAAITAAKSRVWFFGVAGDTDPKSGEPHPSFALASGGQTVISEAPPFCVASAWFQGEPLLLQVNNATNAGQFDWTTYFYER